MNWLNIHTPALRSPEFIACEPVARATWLYVVAHCCEQENGGVLKGARAWRDRQWQQTCGVTLEEVEASSPLLVWKGDDLHVFAYPKAKEEEIKIKRVSGKKGGKQRAQAAAEAKVRAEAKASPELASSLPPGTASSSASDSASSLSPGIPLDRPSTEGEGEGEEEEKEEEKEEIELPAAASPPLESGDFSGGDGRKSQRGFEDFWAAYPRKVSKGGAEKAWKTKRCAPLLPQILAAVDRAKRSHAWTKDGGQFIPHPASWINNRRWEDEIPANGNAAAKKRYTANI